MKTPEQMLKKILDTGECVLPTASGRKTSYPNVFVHGLVGWGERDEIYKLVPYWGLASGDILSFLRNSGYECYGASVGAISGTWDRACELYAQLTGTRVDYGVAHSIRTGHERYGIDYKKPLFEGWSAEKKINLIGHSLGGATVRRFLDILANGCPEEVATSKAAGEPVSPFFEGGRGDWVHSVSAIAAPHNGTTFMDANEDFTAVFKSIFSAWAKALGISKFKGVYDFQLDQFGIYKSPDETMAEALDRIFESDVLSKRDSGFTDLEIDSALELNDTIDILPQVYYFSYPACGTIQNLFSFNSRPYLGMTPILKHFSAKMGKYYDVKTPGGFEITKEWTANDGLANTVSEYYPAGHGGQCLTSDGKQGFVTHSGAPEGNIQPGVWNVMPTRQIDHLSYIGGVFNTGTVQTRMFYKQIMENIDRTLQQ